MASNEPLDEPAPSIMVLPLQWRCPRHGPTDAVMHVVMPGTARTLCMPCLLEVLEQLGVHTCERIP